VKVFDSWQFDTPPKVDRTFTRDALQAAIAGLQLEDTERPEIDQDTEGVLGSLVIQRNSRQKAGPDLLPPNRIRSRASGWRGTPHTYCR
jgi:hypothetical protein